MRKIYTLLCFLLLANLPQTKAQIAITGSLPYTYTQDFTGFNGLAGGQPAGWTLTSAQYRGTGNGNSTSSTGSPANSGGVWGLGISPDFSLGALCSGSASTVTFQVSFVNNTAGTISSLNVAYDFEQWRWAGGNNNGFTVTQTGLGTAVVSGLSQASSSTGGTNGVVSTTHKSISLTGLSVAPGASFSFKWSISDGSGSDNAVAVDNFSITADGNAPLATITQNPLADTACVGTATNFTVTANNATGYQWQEFTTAWNNINNAGVFSGATTTTLHIADVTGLNGHAYRCVVSGAANQVNSDSVVLTELTPIAIQAQPVAAVICAGTDTAFHITATNVQGYQWQVNTGSGFTNITTQAPYSNVQSSVLTMTGVPASYNNAQYRCILSSACGSSDTSQTVSLMVHASPVVALTAVSDTVFCAGDSVQLQASNAGTSIQWLKDGTVISGITTIDYTALSTGSYTVNITDTNGCIGTAAPIGVTVNALPLATITPASGTNICQGNTVVLNANSGTGFTYQWQEDGLDISGATSGSWNAGNNSNYTVIVTDSNSCQQKSTAVAITVIPFPAAAITAGGSTNVCQGSTVTLNGTTGTGLSYQWLLDGNTISGATSSSYDAGTGGSYTVAIASNNGTCIDTANGINVNMLNVPVATITANTATTFCEGDSVLLHTNDSTGLIYQWQLNGINIGAAHDSIYTARTDGNYTVKITNANNCSTTATAQYVTVHPKPNAVITYNSPLTFCDGGAVVLTSSQSSSLSYQWYNDGNAISGATDYDYIVAATGAYTLLSGTTFGCKQTSGPVHVTVNAKPVPVILRNGLQLQTSSTYATYQWYYNNQAIAGANNQVFNATQNGGYFVEVKDSMGCQNRAAVVLINNVGINNIAGGDYTVDIYPNPVKSILHIDAPQAINAVVRDLQGKVVITADNTNQLDLSSLSAGVYMLAVLDKDNQLLKIEQLVKVD